MKRLSLSQFTAGIAEIGAALRTKIELEVDAFPVDAAARAKRRTKALDPTTGFAFFRKTYFPHYHEKPDSLLHECLETKLPAIVADPVGRKETIIAGRGSAKSTIGSLELPLWAILTNLKRFVLLISDASDQAELLLEAIKAEAEVNPRLTYDFPELAPGRVWRADDVVFSNNGRVQVLGSGKKVRGRRHGPFRPDLIVLDDIENDENVRSPAFRDKLEGWIDKGVLKAGPTDGSGDVILIGTILHFDAVLARKTNKPGWGVTRFDAILDWPTRMDLWERFAEAFQNEGEIAALAVYAAHREEMDEGARVTWPAMQPIVRLMLEWAEDPDGFLSERQNEPVSNNSPFRDFQFWVMKRAEVITFGAVDPSLGKRGHGRDPSAILVGALHRASGELDVIEASIRRRLPDRIIEDVIALQREHRCALWFVEAVQFQEFLRTEIMRRAAKAGVALPTVPVTPFADKELRIERLQPPMNAGMIRLHASQRVLIDQLRQWPNGAHDDGPDCLEMLWTGAVEHAATSITTGLLMGSVLSTGGIMQGFRLR